MPVLHMNTESVRSVGEQIRQTAASIGQQSQQVNGMVQALAYEWQGPSATIFVGEIQALLQKLNQFAHAGKTFNQRLQHEVDEWEQVASVLGVGGAASIGVPLPLTGGGEVLGVSTSIPAANYDNMSWKDKLSELERLDQQIAALEKELNGQMPVDGRINEINDEIARLEAEMAEAQKKADTWYNQVIPTLPLQGDDDGVPWRVRTDDFEDEITDYQRKIQDLKNERNSLLAVQDQQEQLAQLKLQRDGLSTLIADHQNTLRHAAENVPFQGQTGNYPRLPNTGNCTWYAAEAMKYASDGKVDITQKPFPGWGNASNWPDAAKTYMSQHPDGVVSAVNNVPQAGSVAFMPPNHVAFVESVEKLEGGQWKIVFSEENASGTVSRYSGEQGNTETISNQGGVKRWRHTVHWGDIKNTQFIHFNY